MSIEESCDLDADRSRVVVVVVDDVVELPVTLWGKQQVLGSTLEFVLTCLLR